MNVYATINETLYEYNSEEEFAVIRQVWLFKLYICIIPLVAVNSVMLKIATISSEFSRQLRNNTFGYAASICTYLVIHTVTAIMWVCGMGMSLLIFEIGCYIYIAFGVYNVGTTRIPNSKHGSALHIRLGSWMMNTKSLKQYNISTSQNKALKACAINYCATTSKTVFSPSNQQDKTLEAYLKKESENAFQNVTLKDIRWNTKDIKRSTIFQSIIYDYCAFLFFSDYRLYTEWNNRYQNSPSEYNKQYRDEYKYVCI